MKAGHTIYLKHLGTGVALAWLTGGTLFFSGSALGHGVGEPAIPVKKVSLTDADTNKHTHIHPKPDASEADAYTRSVKAYVIPDVVLTDVNDRPVRLRELLTGTDPVMMNFIFTSCGAICPVMSKVFSEVPAILGSEAKSLRMISISIDPENDTPQRLKTYAKSFHAGERWKFLTGRIEDVKAVQLAFDNYRTDKMSHEPLTLMRGIAGKPWLRINGFASPEQLVREYRKVLAQ